MTKPFSRREFLRLCGVSSIGLALTACGVSPTPTLVPTNTSFPTSTPLPSATPTPTNTVAPTATSTVTPSATLTRIPVRGLEPYRGVHPRLFVDTDRVTELRDLVRTTHTDIWMDIRTQARGSYKATPPPYPSPDPDSTQFWQTNPADKIPPMALGFLLEKDRQYLVGTQQFALGLCNYPTWGLGNDSGRDLAAAHNLFSLGITYDWLYADLSEQTRQTIRQTLIERGKIMFNSTQDENWWANRGILQNHIWQNMTGLLTAGLAIYDEYPDANVWIKVAFEKISKVFSLFGDDGASHEGPSYWETGMEWLLKFMDLSRTFLNANLYENTWFKQTTFYNLYLTLPRNSWEIANYLVDFADGERGGFWRPDFILGALAREYRNGYAQWLADSLFAARSEVRNWPHWLRLIWYDPTIKPVPPTDLATLHHFRDMDIVVARSGWSGGESLIAYRCGPYLGHKVASMTKDRLSPDDNAGHVHPDNNHFVIFGNGEWQIRDDGYSYKWTRQHNTLLIDGTGQVGEGQQWFRDSQRLKIDAHPTVLKADSNATMDHIVGDAAQAYPDNMGLRRFVRHLVFLKPDVLIVADDILLDQPHNLELRFFPEAQKAQLQPDGSYLLVGKKSVLRCQLLTPQGVTVKTESVAVVDRNNVPVNRLVFRIQALQAKWRNVVALSWAEKPENLKTVVWQGSEKTMIFVVGKQTIELDW